MLVHQQVIVFFMCCLCCVGFVSPMANIAGFSIPQEYRFTLKPDIPQTFTLNLELPKDIHMSTAFDKFSVNGCCQVASFLLCLKFMSSACSDFCEGRVAPQPAARAEHGERARFKLVAAALFGGTGLALRYIPRMIDALRTTKSTVQKDK